MTYLVLGRVGLLLIGVVGGVVLHAVWENAGLDGANDGAKATEAGKRRRKGLDVVTKALDWRLNSKDDEGGPKGGDIDAPTTSQEADFSGFPPDMKGALESFTGAIMRDYVHWWYGPILPGEASFPLACQQTLNRFILSVSSRLSRKRPADVFLDLLTNSSSIVVVFLSELSGALAASRGLEPQRAISEYLEENPDSSLANVLDQKQQKKKLKAVADDILQTFLDRRAYACDPVRCFLREVLAGLILDMTVTSCSRADFINDLIIYALEEGEAAELVQAIDAGVSNATSVGEADGAATAASERLSYSAYGPDFLTVNQTQRMTEHRRTFSKAEEAMEEAMQEAKRLSELIAVEEARKAQNSGQSASPAIDSAAPALPDSSQKDETTAVNGSRTAITESDTVIDESATAHEAPPTYKSFDQILSSQQPMAHQPEPPGSQSLSAPPLTLHNATISIFDDSVPGEKGHIRSKPVAEYLLQIEPATSQYPGWMIPRKYPDFETLHEVLRRISVVSGIAAFTERHQTLPGWKNKTKSSLRTDLEKYLRDALSFQRLAESEGMKRFLEKDQHLGKSSPGTNKGGFGFPGPATFETMSKGMLDVLTSAPKGAAVGGKAIVGGVTGVLGGVGSLGQKKQSSKSPVRNATHLVNGSASSLPRADSNASSITEGSFGRPSQDAFQQPFHTSQGNSRFSIDDLNEPTEFIPLPQRQSYDVLSRRDDESSKPGGVMAEALPQKIQAKDLSVSMSQLADPDQIQLPPPPSEIPDDYNMTQTSSKPSMDDNTTLRTSPSIAPMTYSLSSKSTPPSLVQTDHPTSPSTDRPTRPTPPPLTIQETSVAVELFFATVNELYTLSSAWTLRLALLNTAKSFLLRPGNANLEAIRQLLQSTIIDSNTSDAGIASHINKVRENALPTEDELKAWPPSPSEEEKVRKRKKARRLLVEKGMPQALTSVMGQAASGEALGKVFDCLQSAEVARGLVFALVLQAIRAITQ
ncbi:MAG: hypothetical protein Q9217_002910 [Psora testacea]